MKAERQRVKPAYPWPRSIQCRVGRGGGGGGRAERDKEVKRYLE